MKFMLRYAFSFLLLLVMPLAYAQMSPFEQCKDDCYPAEKTCRKQCPLLGGGKCKEACAAALDQCKSGCKRVGGECSSLGLTDPYRFPAFDVARLLENDVISEEVARAYIDQLNRGFPDWNEFKIERWMQEKLPAAIAELSDKKDCLKRNSHVRLWRFMTLPRYTFKGGYFDFTGLRGKPFVIQTDCRVKETVSIVLQGSDEALRFSLNARDAEWLVKMTTEEESGKVYGSVGAGVGGGGGRTMNWFSDHGTLESHQQLVPELGQANIGFFGILNAKVEVRKVDGKDPLAPVCTAGMTGTMGDLMLPTTNSGSPGTTRVLTLNVDEIRAEARRGGQRYSEGK